MGGRGHAVRRVKLLQFCKKKPHPHHPFLFRLRTRYFWVPLAGLFIWKGKWNRLRFFFSTCSVLLDVTYNAFLFGGSMQYHRMPKNCHFLIKKFRASTQLTQKEFGRVFLIKLATFQRWEQGRGGPNLRQDFAFLRSFFKWYREESLAKKEQKK